MAPATTIQPNSVIMTGVNTSIAPSGDLNPGNISISGMREYANGFTLNGSNVEESVNMGAAVIPNLDSIAEFRILTSNFDAEYGDYSGGQIIVVTKSGGNQLHGGAFEFLRNTDLDSRNFFSADRAKYVQNQFGGTVGGPIKHDKIFFFGDYQETRRVEGLDTGLIPVPSLQDRTGDLSDLASSLTGTVNGQNFAKMCIRDSCKCTMSMARSTSPTRSRIFCAGQRSCRGPKANSSNTLGQNNCTSAF